jgi:pimeloyl-ACP methyl ester carboxylesterase
LRIRVLSRKYVIALVLLTAVSFGFTQKPTTVRAVAWSSRLSLGEHDTVLSGIRFHYVVVGHGPFLVVQAPGWGIGSTYLRIGLAPLEKHFTLIFYDPRGSGSSGRPADETHLSTSDMIDDLERLRMYWNLEGLYLLGHSQGGSVALGYAERYPQRVHKLLLVDTSLLGYDSSTVFKKILDARQTDPQYASSIAHLKDSFDTDAEFKQYFVDVVPFYFYDPVANLGSLLKDIPNSFSLWAFRAFHTSDKSHPLQQEADLSHVRADTLILLGSDDPFSPSVISGRIHSGISGSKMAIIGKSGHFPWIEQPKRFFDSTVHFFEAE